jgi:CheY-like chemotaxis protein
VSWLGDAVNEFETAALVRIVMPRVLIAEENDANAVLIRDFCKDLDFEPTMVGDGRAVVEAVRCCAPDLILMDIDGAVGDGVAATVEIRGLQNVSEQMVIIGLNGDSPALSAACRIAGMNQILSKPLQPDRLIAALRAARAPLNLQANAIEGDAGSGQAEADEAALHAMAAAFGPVAVETPFGRIHYINVPKLARQFGEAWQVISSHIELTTKLVIERHIGESAAYKHFGELDFVLMTPGLSQTDCAVKCHAIAQEICRTLAADESGAKFHLRTSVFNVAPSLLDAAAVEAARAQEIRAANPDILSWTVLSFWPVWDTQRRKFPLHTIRADRGEDGTLLPEVAETIESFGLAAYHEALDISIVADLVSRLGGYETLEEPRLLTLPMHFRTLESFGVMSRFLRYTELIPKKIRERLVIEIHDVPKDIRAVQLAALQKPVLAHCLHTMLVVSPLYRNFAVLKQMSGQIVGVELADEVAEVEQELAALKQFAMLAKQAGLTLAASLTRNRPFRDWGLTSCRYVMGPAVALAQPSLNPGAKFIA